MSQASTLGALNVTHATLASCVTTSGQTICTSSGSGIGAGVIVVVYLAILVVSIIAAVKVVTKAGYSGWWVLVLLVPLVNFVMMLVFAFSKWPVLREVEMLRARTTRGYGPIGPGSRGSGGWGAGGGGTGAPGPWSGPRSMEATEAEPPLPPFWTTDLTSGPGAGSPSANPTPTSPATAGQDVKPPPGWYPTPEGRQRYWDGTAWTDHFA